MTSDVRAVQARLDEAEREARYADDRYGSVDWTYRDWAKDRLRLVERDRATLERHTDREYQVDALPADREVTYIVSHRCGGDRPCTEAQAVLDYWLDGTREGEAK